ncbi:MAG: c-type cytochrome [Magnetospiraceae bacterium]
MKMDEVFGFKTWMIGASLGIAVTLVVVIWIFGAIFFPTYDPPSSIAEPAPKAPVVAAKEEPEPEPAAEAADSAEPAAEPTAMEKMEQTAADVAETVQEAAEEAGTAVAEAADEAAQTAGEVAEEVTAAAEEAAAEVEKGAEAMAAEATEAMENAKEAVMSAMGDDLPGDATAGEAVFKKECRKCHKVSADMKKAVGPNLFGLLGRPAGSVDGFKYSDAMADSGLTWDAETLMKYLEDPKNFVPKNKMAYKGLADEADRQNVISYINSVKE